MACATPMAGAYCCIGLTQRLHTGAMRPYKGLALPQRQAHNGFGLQPTHMQKAVLPEGEVADASVAPRSCTTVLLGFTPDHRRPCCARAFWRVPHAGAASLHTAMHTAACQHHGAEPVAMHRLCVHSTLLHCLRQCCWDPRSTR